MAEELRSVGERGMLGEKVPFVFDSSFTRFLETVPDSESDLSEFDEELGSSGSCSHHEHLADTPLRFEPSAEIPSSTSSRTTAISIENVYDFNQPIEGRQKVKIFEP